MKFVVSCSDLKFVVSCSDLKLKRTNFSSFADTATGLFFQDASKLSKTSQSLCVISPFHSSTWMSSLTSSWRKRRIKKFRVIDGRDRKEERNNNEDIEWKECEEDPFRLGFLFLFFSFLYETDKKVVVEDPCCVCLCFCLPIWSTYGSLSGMSKEMGWTEETKDSDEKRQEQKHPSLPTS